MSQRYPVQDLTTLTFSATYDPTSGSYTLTLSTPAGAQACAEGDVVADYVDPGLGSSVTIEVLDSGTHAFKTEMADGPDWTRDATTNPARSYITATVPATESEHNTIVALIRALDSTSGQPVAARRTQIIIIKRRPIP
ncbi:MAG: hypothetical protein R3B09_24175 [Nannocystaceae bacterium]